MFGLPDKTIKLLKYYFQLQSEILDVRVYGSRAMGTEARGSDVDLAIFTSCNQDISGHVKTNLDDLPTPYLFDIIDYAHIGHSGLKNHIDRVGKIFFKRK